MLRGLNTDSILQQCWFSLSISLSVTAFAFLPSSAFLLIFFLCYIPSLSSSHKITIPLFFIFFILVQPWSSSNIIAPTQNALFFSFLLTLNVQTVTFLLLHRFRGKRVKWSWLVLNNAACRYYVYNSGGTAPRILKLH